MALRLIRCLPFLGLVAAGLALLPCLPGGVRTMAAGDPAEAPAADGHAECKEVPSPETDPLGANGACYVCHMTFVKEDLSKVHLANKVACVKCHGVSDKHANDENIGATKPDLVYKRAEVDAACEKCHEQHDVPARQVLARFAERRLSAPSAVICTDCHGTHKIDRAAEQEEHQPAFAVKNQTSG